MSAVLAEEVQIDLEEHEDTAPGLIQRFRAGAVTFCLLQELCSYGKSPRNSESTSNPEMIM